MIIGIYKNTYTEEFFACGENVESVVNKLEDTSGERIPVQDIAFYEAEPVKVKCQYIIE